MCSLQSLTLKFYVKLTSLSWMHFLSVPKIIPPTVEWSYTSLWFTVCCRTYIYGHIRAYRMLHTSQLRSQKFFSPHNVVVDFEISMLLPNALVHCCRFHLVQACWHHVNNCILRLPHTASSSSSSSSFTPVVSKDRKGYSHESPPVVSVHGHHHCFLNVFTAPHQNVVCLLYTSPSPRDGLLSRMPSSA